MTQNELFDKFKQYAEARQTARSRFFEAAEAIKHLFPTDLISEVNQVAQKEGLSIRIRMIRTRFGGYLHLKSLRGGLLDYDRPFSESFTYHDEVDVRICHKEEFLEAMHDIKNFALVVVRITEENKKHYRLVLDQYFK